MNDIQEFVINILVTSITAATAKTVIAPVERVKMVLQNQEISLQVLKHERPAYNGMLDAFRRVPKEQGILSFWRGNGTNIMRYVPTQSLNFAFNDVYKNVLFIITDKNDWKQMTAIKFIAGGLAGLSSAVIIYPLDFCATKITADIGTDPDFENKSKVEREYKGLRHCLSKVYKIEGFKGYYSGMTAAFIGLALHRSIYFGLFDFNKMIWNDFKDSDEYIPLYMSFFSAQCAALTASFICYPFDTVMRRMMIDAGRPQEYKNNFSMKETFKHIYKTKGIKGFYIGTIANSLRCTGGSLVLVLYDQILYYTEWKKRIISRDK